jgi:hypothetical protein
MPALKRAGRPSASAQKAKHGDSCNCFCRLHTRAANMKMCLLLRPLLSIACATLVLCANADPILPYQQPIADQLAIDQGINNGDKTINKAVNTFHKTSKSLNSDISILRSLNKLLADTPGYASLLDNAANAYQSDFQGRRDELNEQIIPAPLGVNKTFARSSIAKVDKALSNAVNAATTTLRISSLSTAASKLASASNAVQRALKSPVGFSSMFAHIGELSFTTTKGSVVAAANFQTADGTFIGEFTTNGVLQVSGFQSGTIARGITVSAEGVGTNVPAIYPLGVGENRAFYDAIDFRHKLEYHFQADATLTNATVTNAFLSIDFIGTNYIIGRFAFVGTNIAPVSVDDTNTLVTISQGEFQLNFRR